MRLTLGLALLVLAGCWSGDRDASNGVPAGNAGEAADPANWSGTAVGITSASRLPFTCTVEAVVDGDTLRCAEREVGGPHIRVRMSGIAARERTGACIPLQPCPEASAGAAVAALTRLAERQVLRCEEVERTLQRRVAFCATSAGVDLSCAMLAGGTVAKWDRYWGNHDCPRRPPEG
ncbi:MAG TPA: hypothetical protein VF552_08295 [Allosphingosinicella sp.]